MNVNPLRLRGLLLALISTFALAVSAGVAAAAPADGAATAAEVSDLRTAIARHRAATWHWQRVMGKERKPTRYAERRSTSLTHLVWLRDLWRGRHTRARLNGKRPPNRAAWLCIHRYEGRWSDPNAPYYGGLQMSMDFQRAFGRYLLRKKGTANRWKPVEQMWTAERARRSGLGFYPWPNTARRCGLI
jgi:hypothetical protein